MMMCDKRVNPVYMIIFLTAFVSLANLGFINHEAVWNGSSRGIREPEIRCLAIHPQNGAIVFAGTEKALYRSTNKGQDFYQVFQAQGSQRVVNDIYIREDSPSVVYCATNSGLFESKDSGDTWDRIFFAGDSRERQCLCVSVSDSAIYVGTYGGLFCRRFGATQWAREKGELSSQPIFNCLTTKLHTYFSTASQIYRLDKTTLHIKKVFSVMSKEDNGAESISDVESGEIERIKQIKDLAFSANSTNRLYAATSKGIFYTDDYGHLWHRLNSDGMPTADITSLSVLDSGDLFVGTRKGVFQYQNKRWISLYQGMQTQRVNFLAKGSNHKLYAATDSGFFILAEKQALSNAVNINYKDLAMHLGHEPTITEVHTMAIDYAEVSPDKIKDWRVSARKRAWLPDVSFGVDGDKNITRGDSVYGSSSTSSSYVGPDDKTFYDNLGWDVSLSWDLGDLVWSTDQTTIDSRSKLMVELREDILDQVTRLYFERRRLQAELMAVQQIGAQEKFDRHMRIDELTALIDALTGGKFSKEIIKSKQQTAVSHQPSVISQE